MDIEIYSVLATSILLISLATIVFSIYSYILFRVREGRKLKKTAGHGHGAAPEPAPEPAPEVPAESPLPEATPGAAPEPIAAEAEQIAALAAAAGQSNAPAPAPPAPGVKRTTGRFFKPYNPGS